MIRSDDDIFQDALAQPVANHAAFLDEACAGDAACRARIAALLAAHDEAEKFFASPVMAHFARVPEEKPGDRIGHYTLREKIGEGGCGVVWLADQEKPVRRLVALKVIKLGMDTKEVVARFDAERQALAMMDHPNIAKVFDAGAADSGRPFFVMELVRGLPITRYCDERQLSPAARLALFVDVCHAIQHAHQKGVIHRDIKPSNVLVAQRDDVAVVKVIDFGIAKAIPHLRDRLTDATVLTMFAQFIGTPAYMSPEQAELGGLDVDTRTDIYSLGALLYELLAGRPPFDPKSLVSSGLDEVRRIIREVEPPRPSTRVSTLSDVDRSMLAKLRGTVPNQLSSQLRGDLDWIVMKSLEKNRARRYETASALAADVQRHLRHEPVTARPPRTAYLLGRLVRRHRVAFGAAAVVAMTLVAGVIVSTWQAIRATRAEHAEVRLREAETRQRERAETSEAAAWRRAYASDMNLAQDALAADNLALAQTLLNRHRPQPGRPDLRGWEWRYLWQFCQSDATAVFAELPDTAVNSLAVSADGEWLAAGEEKHGNLSIWNVRTREVVRVPAGDAGVRVAFSPAEPLLAFAAAEGGFPGERYHVALWSPATGQVVRQLELGSYCGGLQFSADGATLFTLVGGVLGKPTEVAQWRVIDGMKLASHPVPSHVTEIRFSRFAVSPAERFAAFSTSNDGRLHLIDLESGREQWSVPAADEQVRALAFSPDGKILASGPGFTESTIRLWDVATGAEIGRLEGHRRFVSRILFSADGKQLFSAGGDQTIRVWDVAERRLLRTLRGHKAGLGCMEWMADRRALVSGAQDGTILLWDGANDRRKPPYLVVPSATEVPSAANAWMFTAEGAVRTFAPSGRGIVEYRGPDFRETTRLFDTMQLLSPRFSRDGRFMGGMDEQSMSVRIWEDGRRLREFPRGAGERLWLVEPGFRKESALLGRARVDKSLWLEEWDLQTGQLRREWRLPVNGEWPVASPDERFVVVPTSAGQYWRAEGVTDGAAALIRLELATDRRVALTARTREMQLGANFSRDGRGYAIASAAGFTEVLDVSSWQRIATLGDVMTPLHSAVFSADGARLATGGSGAESVLLWESANYQRVLTLPTNQTALQPIAFSPDGNVIGASARRGGIFLWRAPSWDEIAAVEKTEAR